jgi:hypothetical protein
VKGSTNGCFASAEALAGSMRSFIDWDKHLVEKVVEEGQEKIPLVYVSD